MKMSDQLTKTQEDLEILTKKVSVESLWFNWIAGICIVLMVVLAFVLFVI